VRKLFLLSAVMLLSACATVSYRPGGVGASSADFIEVSDLCAKHSLRYDFDTIDDMVKIYGGDKEIRLILNSAAGYCNGKIFNLVKRPFYAAGKIFIPRQLEEIIFLNEDIYQRPVFAVKTIVIDPGHGGKDPGATSVSGMKEKDLNLKVAKYLEEELSRRGFRVFLTRSCDIFLELQERVEVARKRNADIFISIHSNSSESRRLNGLEVYYLTPNRLQSQSRALELARTRGLDKEFGRGDIPVAGEAILWDLLLTKNYSLSVTLTNTLYQFFKNMGFKIALPKRAPFYVLRLAYVPSVLVEIGYLSNHYEEKSLRKDYYQRQIAEAIALGVVSLNKRYSSYLASAGDIARKHDSY